MAREIFLNFRETERFLSASSSSSSSNNTINDGTYVVVISQDEANALSLEMLRKHGCIEVLESYRCGDRCCYTTPVLSSELVRLRKLIHPRNKVRKIDDWNTYLRCPNASHESFLVICAQQRALEMVRKKVPDAHATDHASICLEILPCTHPTVILYEFNRWTFFDFYRIRRFLEERRIKDVVYTLGDEGPNPSGVKDWYLTTAVTTIINGLPDGRNPPSTF